MIFKKGTKVYNKDKLVGEFACDIHHGDPLKFNFFVFYDDSIQVHSLYDNMHANDVRGYDVYVINTKRLYEGKSKGVSQEVEALVRFYRGRQFLSIKDIREFSRVYNVTQDVVKNSHGRPVLQTEMENE